MNYTLTRIQTLATKEFGQAIPRIIIALILGFAISAPFEIKILESEIDSKLSAYQKEYAENLNNQTDTRYKQKVAKLEKDKAAYEQKLEGYVAEIDTKRAEKNTFIKLNAVEVGSWRKQLDLEDGQINQMSDDLRQAYKIVSSYCGYLCEAKMPYPDDLQIR
jgi:hypothetical protein